MNKASIAAQLSNWKMRSEAKDLTAADRLRRMVATAAGEPIAIEPVFARRLLVECNFDGQRQIRPGRLQAHERRITSGTWNESVSTIHFARTPDGRLHLVNGQHRLTAISNVGVTVGSLIVLVEEPDMPSVRRLYALFDDPASSRNDGEILDGAGIVQELGLSRTMTVAAFRAVVVLRNGLEPLPTAGESIARDREGRIGDLAQWRDELLAAQEIIAQSRGGLSRHLRTSSCLAAMTYTLRYQPTIASEFWGGLARNDRLSKNDPRSRLITDLLDKNLKTGTIRYGMQRIAVAWNAFVDGRDLVVIRTYKDGPIVFKGTPKK